MRFDLKRSLFLSVAALGFVAAAGMANSQTASAKTYARVTSNSKMAMLPQDRNVTFTGDNALYTKAGTLKGARVVASKATLSSFSNASSSTHNVRAYRIATTNRGSIYYKVVTYDGSYRGWIYGGKTDSDFNGGVQQYRTFTNQAFSTLTSSQQNGTYKITTPGTANDGTQVTYKSPAYTNYKVGRAITDSSPYANTQFRIDAVGYRTKEGSSDQWVHIYDPANPNSQATGWIKMSGLTQTNATTPIADNQIQFNIMDPNNSNNTLVSFNWTKAGATRNSYLGNYNTTTHNWSLDSNDQASLQTAINNALSGYNSTHGTNYSYNISNLNQSQLNNLAVAQFGGSVKLYLNSAIADNAVRVYFRMPNGNNLSTYYDWTKSGANRGNLVGYQNGSNWSFYGSDQSDIQGKLATALAGTGYGLNYNNNNTLNQDQINAIASGHYGSSVTISVVPVNQTVSSTIRPTVGNSQLTGTSETTLSDSVVVPTTPFNLTSVLPASVITDGKTTSAKLSSADLSGLTTALGGSDSANVKKSIDALNESLSDAAAAKYINTGLNLSYSGTQGATISESALLNYVNNNNLGKLESPNFVQISYAGNTASITNNHLEFTANNTDTAATFGNPVNVYYKVSDNPIINTK